LGSAAGASAGRERKRAQFSVNPGPRLKAHPGMTGDEKSAKMRSFCDESPRKLMQFFPKNDDPPQTDSERGIA
jgi:hypothetical protein